jgi:hypothetical protein
MFFSREVASIQRHGSRAHDEQMPATKQRLENQQRKNRMQFVEITALKCCQTTAYSF